jgi:periplasmic copper chaperone A
MRAALRCLLATALVVFAFSATAHDYTVGSLHIEHPWSRATPQGARVGGGYLVIENRGSTADRFVSASAEFAGRTELHEMAVTDGVMRMRPLANGVEIAPGMTAKFEPGGLHIMFLDLKRPLEKGDRVKATLNFEKAGAVEVVFVVEAMGSGSGHSNHGH